MSRLAQVSVLAFAVLSFSVALPAQEENASTNSDNPEMNRLAKMFVGDWNTAEKMERSDDFPNGGQRTGTSHCELGVNGLTLICRGHSNGSAGELSYLIAIWWEKEANLYRFFTCFNDAAKPCVVRGTAHWEGETFVNDYEESVKGRKTRMTDSFKMIDPNTRTLVFAIEGDDRKMKPLISTRSERRRN